MIHTSYDLLSQVIPIIKEAGILLRAYGDKEISAKEKALGGLVTEADIAIEQYLIKYLTPILPGALFFAEESGKSKGENDYCWVIDPLDGTTNFTQKIPFFCISVALTYKDEPIMGLVYHPLLDELFYAQAGKGAYLNGKKIQVTKKTVAQSVFSVKLYTKKRGISSMPGQLTDLAAAIYTTRELGSAALEIAYVASGRLDGMIRTGLKWWDIAASMLIAQEAGATMSDFQGEKITPHFTSFIASGASNTQAKVLALIKSKV
jgi:myo-inositol-1(or 4)-monophosphatase